MEKKIKKEKNVNLVIEKTKKEKDKLKEEKIKKAKEEYENFQKELEKKMYLVEGGKITADYLIYFLEKEAEWKGGEALGVVKAHEDVVKAIKENEKQLFLSALCIEAIAYYISKKSGIGLQEAKEFKNNIFMPINEAMGKINADREKLKELEYNWAALSQGIETEK